MGLGTIIVRMNMASEQATREESDKIQALYPDAKLRSEYLACVDSTSVREAERNAAVQAAQADMLALAAAVRVDPTLAAAVEATKAKAKAAMAEALKVPG